MPSDPSSLLAASQAPANRPTGDVRRVLIADDEPMVRRVLAKWFAREGWDVSEAADGAEAIRLLAQGRPFDLVLCDHQMPRVGGPEIFTWVAANLPALAPGVVIMSGDVQEPALATFVLSADCRLFAKPFDLGLLTQLVHEVVSRAQAA